MVVRVSVCMLLREFKNITLTATFKILNFTSRSACWYENSWKFLVNTPHHTKTNLHTPHHTALKHTTIHQTTPQPTPPCHTTPQHSISHHTRQYQTTPHHKPHQTFFLIISIYGWCNSSGNILVVSIFSTIVLCIILLPQYKMSWLWVSTRLVLYSGLGRHCMERHYRIYVILMNITLLCITLHYLALH